MIQKLPIFPLNTVLFPGAPLQLHIFEERYRLMIGRCIQQNSPFGVVLIRMGSEINPDDPRVPRQLGGEAVPYAVGTTAQINTGESVRLEDGRYYLIALGQRRFRIQYLAQRQPYLIASVAYLAEQSTPDTAKFANQVRGLYMRYWEVMSALAGVEKPPDELPENVADLSYWMAHRLQVDNYQKQRWLEADVTNRLRAISAAFRTELAMFPNSEPGERERGSSRPGFWN
jgi:Lon protease-like protein